MGTLFKLLLTSLWFFAITSNAQITKGNWMFGGDASFSNKTNYQNEFKATSKVKFTELDINANAGYFFMDKLQAGIRVGYSDYKVKTFTGSDRHFLNYGVYSRYYFLKPEKLVNIFLDGEYFIGSIANASGEFKDNINGYAISAGPTIFLNSSVAIELGIEYSSTKFKGINNTTENNLQFSLGFQIFLTKK